MLHINALTYRIGGRALFEGATVAIPKGHKVGLVGRNGSGKTTLFKIILGELHPDAGTVTVRGRARVGAVAQESPSGDKSLLETVLAADPERAHLLARAESETDPHAIAEIHTRLADIDAHGAPARAAQILAGLGFDDHAQARPCNDVSGGWRMRVALAAALFARPDLLLLDEPTNHLDLEAALWLESHLAAFTGTLILISHDRDLLNRAVDGIVHLENGRLALYAGGYDRFERARRERLERDARFNARQQAERRRIQAFVDRFRAKATKARQAQSRLKKLQRLQPIATVIEEKTVAFDFPDPEPLSPPLVALEDAAVGYGEKPVLKKLNLRLDMDDRVALLGANGNGKSTLVKLLAGRLKPLAGSMRSSRKLRVGYVAQHQTDELDAHASAYAHAARRLPLVTEEKLRAHLGRFGFSQAKAEVAVADLSGGEKARLLFALMSLEAPHLMLLDEPTNHLDVDAREALIEALNAYDGAVVLVSHDSHLIDLVADRLWLVAGGACRPFDGDLDDYRALVAEAARADKGEARRGRASAKGHARKEARRERAAARAETQELRAQAKEAEKRLEALGRERAELEAALADPALYQGPACPPEESRRRADEITRLQKRLADVAAAIAAEEERWLEAHAAMEDAAE
jgi:ATP-binding cassette subfamily F protein 3